MNIVDVLIDMLVIAGVIVILMLNDAQADEVQFTVGSSHYHEGDYNEINPGLIYGKDITETVKVVGGVYYNSYRKTTALVGLEAQVDVVGPISAGAQAGFATGYKEMTGSEVTPMGTVFIQVGKSPGIRLSVIPHKYGAAGMSVVYGW